MFFDKARNNWRVQYRERGKRRSASFDSRRAALEFERSLGIDSGQEGHASLTFEHFAQDWMRDYCRVRKSESNWRNDEAMILSHLIPAFGAVPLRELRKSHLMGLQSEMSRKCHSLTGKPLSVRTQNYPVQLARKMLATAVDWDLLESNPFAQVRLHRVPKQLAAFWMPDERDAFLAAARAVDPDFAEIATVAVFTGLRLGELAALRRDSVDFARRRIIVAESFNLDIWRHMATTKGKASAEIECNSAVWSVLAPKVFLPASADLFRKASFRNRTTRIRRIAKIAGVRPLRFHDLRHTFASCLAMAGVDLLVIQRLMRHKSYTMTLRYAHLHPSHGQGVTEVLCSPGTRGTRNKSSDTSALR